MSISHKKQMREIIVVFDNKDVDGLNMPHTDALVITLWIFDTDVRRVLIDPDISANIIQLQVVKELKITSQVIPKLRLLSGFYNSSEMTMGEVILVTNAEEVVKDTPF